MLSFYIVMKLSIFFLCYSFYWFVWPLWYCEQFDAGARQMENFDFARKVFLISMLSSLICGFMTGFGGTAQLLISYNYENGRI
jgi:hypothetical protein